MDLIDRQAAIDALGEEPLVWNDGEDELAERDQWRRDANAIKALPSAQPEIIRCKDCKYRDADDFCTGRGYPNVLVPDDGFCDKGERRK